MAIELDVPMVRKLIEIRFGSVDALAVEWELRIEDCKQHSGEARDRATIYRWLKYGMPAKRDDIFGLAALLDVDPIALLRVDAEFVKRHFANERFLFQIGGKARSKLHPFWEVFVPSPNWPNATLPRDFFGREWTKFLFCHEAKDLINVFAGITIEPAQSDKWTAPRVHHFAYRRSGAVDFLWRPYGVVIHRHDCTRLLSENGTYQERRVSQLSHNFLVETYFGPGAAEFQIVSLHSFRAQVAAPSENPLAVRFPA